MPSLTISLSRTRIAPKGVFPSSSRACRERSIDQVGAGRYPRRAAVGGVAAAALQRGVRLSAVPLAAAVLLLAGGRGRDRRPHGQAPGAEGGGQAGGVPHQRRTLQAGEGVPGQHVRPAPRRGHPRGVPGDGASGWPNWPGSATTPTTRAGATWTCSGARSTSGASAARTGSCGSTTRRPAGLTATSGSAPGTAGPPLPLWLGTGDRGPLTRDRIYQMVRRRGEQAGVRVHPHRFRRHFSHTLAGPGRGGGGPDGAERLVVPADAPAVRRQRTGGAGAPALRPRHGRLISPAAAPSGRREHQPGPGGLPSAA
jgi:hypothetical protein